MSVSKCKHRGSIIPYITVDGLRKYDPTEILNHFGTYYSTMDAELAAKIKPGKATAFDYAKSIPRNLNSIVLKETSVGEIENLISGLANKSSSGHDNMSNVMLKQLNQSISYPLALIFNQSIQQGLFPDLMKIAEVIPLYNGKEQDYMINYRPISLLMTISKLLEKIIHKRLSAFLIKHNILYKSQFGFRNKHNCEHAISELIGKLLHAKESGEYSASIFLDLSKAFDTINHEYLLMKMERYGIRGNAQAWFASYLSNRKLIAKVKTSPSQITYSAAHDVTYGTAQGSCLGLLLFILFSNDVHLLPLYGRLILFADDTTLVCTHKTK